MIRRGLLGYPLLMADYFMPFHGFPGVSPSYRRTGRMYGTNGKREVARRARQIAAGRLKVSA